MVVALLGLFRAGGAYLPLTRTTRKRALPTCRRSSPALVITSKVKRAGCWRDEVLIFDSAPELQAGYMKPRSTTRAPRTDLCPASTSARLCHLHLRLHRNAQRVLLNPYGGDSFVASAMQAAYPGGARRCIALLQKT